MTQKPCRFPTLLPAGAERRARGWLLLVSFILFVNSGCNSAKKAYEAACKKNNAAAYTEFLEQYHPGASAYAAQAFAQLQERLKSERGLQIAVIDADGVCERYRVINNRFLVLFCSRLRIENAQITIDDIKAATESAYYQSMGTNGAGAYANTGGSLTARVSVRDTTSHAVITNVVIEAHVSPSQVAVFTRSSRGKYVGPSEGFGVWLAYEEEWLSMFAQVMGEIFGPRALIRTFDSPGDSAFWAQKGLLRLKNAAVIDSLLDALSDVNWRVRYHAAGSLGDLKDSRVVMPLVAALKDNESMVLIAAIGALRKLGDHRSVDPLIALMEKRRGKQTADVAIRAQAALALEKLTGEHIFDDPAAWRRWQNHHPRSAK